MKNRTEAEQRLLDALHRMYHEHWINSMYAARACGNEGLYRPYDFDEKGWPVWREQVSTHNEETEDGTSQA